MVWTRRSAAVAMTVLGMAGCATPPQLVPDLEPRRAELLVAMRDAATKPVPVRPALYTLSGNWGDMEFGSVVANDGPMIVVRLRSDAGLPPSLRRVPRPNEEYVHAVVPVSAPHATLGSCIIGDGIVVAKIDDLLICRYFVSPYDSPPKVCIGDEASIDHDTSVTLKGMIARGTAEWFPASPAR